MNQGSGLTLNLHGVCVCVCVTLHSNPTIWHRSTKPTASHHTVTDSVPIDGGTYADADRCVDLDRTLDLIYRYAYRLL